MSVRFIINMYVKKNQQMGQLVGKSSDHKMKVREFRNGRAALYQYTHQPTRPKTRTKVLAISSQQEHPADSLPLLLAPTYLRDPFSLADCMALTKCIWAQSPPQPQHPGGRPITRIVKESIGLRTGQSREVFLWGEGDNIAFMTTKQQSANAIESYLYLPPHPFDSHFLCLTLFLVQ